MRKGGSKQKGASYEREFCVGLSKWASLGDRSDVFWRSAMSGGRATVAKKTGTLLKSQAGDISAVNTIGQPFIDKFYTELKHYKDLEYAGIITGTGNLANFWKSTVTEANIYKKQPLLVAKQNNRPTVLFFQTKGLEMLDLNLGHCVIIAPRLGAHGLLFDDFLKWAHPF